MNNTTYTANENCFLIDGEVYLTENNKIDKYWLYVDKYTGLVDGTVEKNVLPESWYEKLHDKDCYKNVTHSTKPLDGVTLLPRDKFVKPKDVEKLARKESERIVTPTIASGFYSGFMHGYNANPNEFSYDFVINAISLARSTNMMADEIIDGLHPLSLPASLEINEQGEIVNVIW